MSKNKSAELALLIMNAGRLLHQKMLASGARNGMSMLRFKIMAFVGEQGSVSMKELATFLGVTAPSTTVLVNRLVKSGEFVRVPGSDDRRSVSVKLTTAGKKDLQQNFKLIVDQMGLILSRLSPSDVKALTSILKNLLKQ